MVKHTQTIRRLLPTNSLSVFDHFVGLDGTICESSSRLSIVNFRKKLHVRCSEHASVWLPFDYSKSCFLLFFICNACLFTKAATGSYSVEKGILNLIFFTGSKECSRSSFETRVLGQVFFRAFTT